MHTFLFLEIIVNAIGQEIRQGELSNLISTIDVSKLPKGSYIMLISTENYSHSFLVESSLNEVFLNTDVAPRSFLLRGRISDGSCKEFKAWINICEEEPAG